MKIMTMEIRTARTSATATSFSELVMLSAVSWAIRIDRFSSSASSFSITSLTAEETSMAVLLCCLVMEMEMVSSPL